MPRRVREQVVEDLDDPPRRGHHPRQVLRKVDVQDVTAAAAQQGLPGLIHQAGHLRRLERDRQRAGLDAPLIQQVGDQAAHVGDSKQAREWSSGPRAPSGSSRWSSDVTERPQGGGNARPRRSGQRDADEQAALPALWHGPSQRREPSGFDISDALRTDHARQRVPLRAGARRRLEGDGDDEPEGSRPAASRSRHRLRGMSGRTGHFAGCTNWNGGDGCDYTLPSCGACGTGMPVKSTGGLFECSDPSCRSKQPGCRCRPPRSMVVRRQPRTQKRFWGCWRYGEAGACGRTRPIG